MSEIDMIRADRFEWIGEVGTKRAVQRQAMPDDLTDIPPDVWPGKWTDIDSLERNAEAFRRAERRKAFRAFMRMLFRRR